MHIFDESQFSLVEHYGPELLLEAQENEIRESEWQEELDAREWRIQYGADPRLEDSCAESR